MEIEVIEPMEKGEFYGVYTVFRMVGVGESIQDENGLVLTCMDHYPDSVVQAIKQALENL